MLVNGDGGDHDADGEDDDVGDDGDDIVLMMMLAGCEESHKWKGGCNGRRFGQEDSS